MEKMNKLIDKWDDMMSYAFLLIVIISVVDMISTFMGHYVLKGLFKENNPLIAYFINVWGIWVIFPLTILFLVFMMIILFKISNERDLTQMKIAFNVLVCIALFNLYVVVQNFRCVWGVVV